LIFKPLPEKQDIIFYRNKLIAFTYENQKKIVCDILSCLEPGGFLISGYQENIMDFPEASKQLEIFNRYEHIFRKKN
jgi:chemotaxis methyl-accepting protein methylase